MQNMAIFFSVVKNENVIRKILIFFLFLLKTLIVEAVLTSTHNKCFGAKIRKIGINRYILAYPNFTI